MNMRSFLIFPHATVANSGNYVCHVLEPVLDQTASASVNITVLGQPNPRIHTKLKQTDAGLLLCFTDREKSPLLYKPLQVKVKEVPLLKEMKRTSVYFCSHGADALSDTLNNRPRGYS